MCMSIKLSMNMYVNKYEYVCHILHEFMCTKGVINPQ